MERGEFNDLMKDAFKDAEATPSENVWTNIELELEKEEGGAIRRRLLYYKMVAAASVIFALSVGAASLFVLDSSSKFQEQQALLNESSVKSSNENPKQPSATNKEVDSENGAVGKASDEHIGALKNDEGNNASAKGIDELNTQKTDNSLLSKTSRLTEREVLDKDNPVPPNALSKKGSNGVSNSIAKNNELAEGEDELNNKRKVVDNSSLSVTSGLVTTQVSDESKVNPVAANTLPVKESNGMSGSVTMGNELAKHDDQLNNQSKVTGHSSLPVTSGLAGMQASSNSNLNSVAANMLPQENAQLRNQQLQRAIDGDPMALQSNSIQTASVSALPRKMKPTIIKPEDAEVKPDAGALLLAKLAEREQAIQAEENKNKQVDRSERLWTSVGIAAGSFSAVNSSVSPTAMANAAADATTFNQNTSTANQQSKASGSTYSVGINIGTKVAKRWIVQGGLNYMTQGSDYTANSVVASADYKNFEIASLNNNSGVARDQASSQVVSTASYQVNNTLQYINVPLQAGYIIINRKVSVQVNTGISTDLFLQNTLTPEDGGLEKTTQGSGSESPYRTVNFSGLVGTEISYKMGKHYRLALNPGVRYPFSSIYKSDVGVSASPLTFDVGLRFRYIFH